MKKVNNLSSLPSMSFGLPNSSVKKDKKQSEFQEILEGFMSDSSDEGDEYKLSLPKHGTFWDDGYSDIRHIS